MVPENNDSGSAVNGSQNNQYPQDFDDPKREFLARLVPFAQTTLVENVDDLQDDMGSRAVALASGQTVRAGAKLVRDVIVIVESRSGVIAETDDQGNIKFQATFPETDKRGRTKRGRFYTGLQIEAITLGIAKKTVDLRERGREAREPEIKGKIMELSKQAIDEAQRKGQEVDTKIIREGFEYRPPYLQPPLVKSVRLEPEVAINPTVIGELVSFANNFIREKGGRSIEPPKIQLARFTEHLIVARTCGTMVDQVIPRTSLSIMVKTVKGSEAFGALRGSCGSLEQCLRRYIKEGESDDLRTIVEKLCQQVLDEAGDLDRAEGAGILGSRCPVIFAPQVAGVFAHECFGHPAEGDIICENSHDQAAQIKLKPRLDSLLSECKHFSVIDSPHQVFKFGEQEIHRFNWGSFEVDHYGEPAIVCTIVENGVMKEAMTNMHTHEYVISGMQGVIERMNRRGLSGSSRFENYGADPLIRMRNTFILPDPDGPATKEEMAAKYNEFKVKKGVYIKSTKGGWVDTRNGTFCIIGNLCYLIENGMVTNKPIKDVNVAGKLGDVVSMIGGLGNTASMHHTFTGFCGKNNQWVPVDGGGPLVFLKEATIGGGSARPWMELVADYAMQLEQIQEGKRSKGQLTLSEVEVRRAPEDPKPRICCVLTEMLPLDVMRRVITGERRVYPTHEIVWDPALEQERIVARSDRHAI